ncbi:MAG TPA: metalloregulator ArsR/SmtB family transcription factor [Myxococcota bacterium]|nr:metalloregulator ArsR/SmtB family transcription factor [Myxococcota bacterium]HQK52513.1 metalloregulator ArsR/SmtB family transcription factor [Myxococcota bacterium]
MDASQVDRIAKALADSRRRDILETLVREGVVSCGALAERFPVGQSTISHHLKILLDAGVVRVRREGQFGFFSVNQEVLGAFLRAMQDRLLGKGQAGEGGPPPVSREPNVVEESS